MDRALPVVLLVDGHHDSLDMYAFSLGLQGFQPVCASTSEEGFTRACECDPEVIGAELTLPGASGLELARRLRQDARTEHAGIIMLAGHAVGAAAQQASEAGCDRFLLKPCIPDALGRTILAVLGDLDRARAPRSLPQTAPSAGAKG